MKYFTLFLIVLWFPLGTVTARSTHDEFIPEYEESDDEGEFIHIDEGTKETVIGDDQYIFIPVTHSLHMFEYALACIRNAQQSIEMSCCYTGGEILHQLLDAFDERLRNVSDLKIHVIASPILLLDEDHESIEKLQQKYPGRFNLLLTAPVPVIFPEYATSDNHLKCLIVDERYFSFGGTNYDDSCCTEGTFTPPHVTGSAVREHMPHGVRDYDVVGRGPVAEALRKEFYKHYALWSHYGKNPDDFIIDPEVFAENNGYTPIDPNKGRAIVLQIDQGKEALHVGTVKLIMSGPNDKPNKITKEYERLIDLAEKEIVIGNLYACPVEAIHEALKKSVNRGVALTYVTNGNYDHSPYFNQYFYLANRINYVPYFYGRDYSLIEGYAASKALAKNTEIYEYVVPGILYHKKVMVVDERFVVVGSYNLGIRSDTYDFEGIMVIDSEELAKEVKDVITADKKYCEKISPDQARSWYFNPYTAYLAAVQKQFHGFF